MNGLLGFLSKATADRPIAVVVLLLVGTAWLAGVESAIVPAATEARAEPPATPPRQVSFSRVSQPDPPSRPILEEPRLLPGQSRAATIPSQVSFSSARGAAGEEASTSVAGWTSQVRNSAANRSVSFSGHEGAGPPSSWPIPHSPFASSRPDDDTRVELVTFSDAPWQFQYAALAQPMETPSNGDSSGGGAAGRTNDDKPIGQAPEETNTELQFLRQDTILLEPREYQFDIGLQYVNADNGFALATFENNNLQVGEARRRQRLLLMPIEFRLGLSPVTQGFVNVPFGWANSEFSFGGGDEFGNSAGIGDVSAGLTRLLIEPSKDFQTTVLGTFAVSAPTGNSDFATSISTPGSSLGEGFWSLSAGLNFVRTYDPVVVYFGFGYRHRFASEFFNPFSPRDPFQVTPGPQVFYRFGVGFAVNPRVTLSTSFIGQYIGASTVNGIRVAGDIREPMQIRLAATIVRKPKSKSNPKARTIEPFINFGVTEAAVDSIFGMSWTY